MTDPSPLPAPFIELQSVDSTNNYARSLIARGKATHGTAIFAHDQLRGKGQRGRDWITEKDAGISLTVVLDPLEAGLGQPFQLSACVALAACGLMHDLGVETRIKWPNDLYWEDRKLGGILIENVYSAGHEQSRWVWSVAGIGININQEQFPKELVNPVSVRQITGRRHEPRDLAIRFCGVLQDQLGFLREKGFDAVLEIYNQSLYKRNNSVRLRKENRVFDAVVVGVSGSGKLIARHAIEEEFSFEEVEWVK